MKTFFFYDLETSGLSARYDRIMQFAGQRTTLDLEPIGDPVNLLIRLDDDTLPSPGAIMVTKITPQSTTLDGLTEREFCAYAFDEIFTPNTITVGYNSVRFDDDFMRHLFWRNFCEPYSWQWKDGRSRWDLLDVVRLVRALRPDGITWPLKRKSDDVIFASNRLEYLTKLNDINHDHAHDALSDVFGLIGVANLLKTRQPKIYDYLFQVRDKTHVAQLVDLKNPRPFVYASGRYENEYSKTTVAYPLCAGPNGSVYVYDLRYNLEDLPKAVSDLPQAESKKAKANSEKAEAVSEKPQSESEKPKAKSTKPRRVPTYDDPFPIVKKLALNKCPAVAPLGVLDQKTAPAVEIIIDDLESGPESKTPKSKKPKKNTETSGWEKIGLTRETIEKNLKTLLAHPEFIKKIAGQTKSDFPKSLEVEATLYDAFLSDSDETLCSAVRNADAYRLKNFHPNFADPRLPELLVHYKARNFPESLTEAERESWEKYRFARLNRQAENFMKELSALDAAGADDYIIEELKLWYESLQ